MPTYEVEVCVDGYMKFQVEAKDEKEAETVAIDRASELVTNDTFLMAFRPELCQQS